MPTRRGPVEIAGCGRRTAPRGSRGSPGTAAGPARACTRSARARPAAAPPASPPARPAVELGVERHRPGDAADGEVTADPIFRSPGRTHRRTGERDEGVLLDVKEVRRAEVPVALFVVRAHARGLDLEACGALLRVL